MHKDQVKGAAKDASGAATALRDVFVAQQLERLQDWGAQRLSYPARWREAAFHMRSTTFVTPEELEQLRDEIDVVLSRFRDRPDDPESRPAGAQPVQLVAFGHPLPPLDGGVAFPRSDAE